MKVKRAKFNCKITNKFKNIAYFCIILLDIPTKSCNLVDG